MHEDIYENPRTGVQSAQPAVAATRPLKAFGQIERIVSCR